MGKGVLQCIDGCFSGSIDVFNISRAANGMELLR